MNLKSVIKICIVLSLLTFSSGCVNNSINNSIAGKYYHNETTVEKYGWVERINESITIYNDFTYYYKNLNRGDSSSGTITQHDDDYVFNGPLGTSMIGRFDNNSLYTDQGIFIKEVK